MTKLEELFKKAEDHAAKVNQTRNDILFMQKRLEEKKKAAEDLADAGDEEAYIDIMHGISDLERRLYVKGKIVNSTEPVISSEEMQEAWDEYAQSYNKRFQTRYKAFERQREQLCKLYAELIADQDELLQIRAKAGRYSGLGENGVLTDASLWKFSFDRLPGSIARAYNGISSISAPFVDMCGRRTTDLLAAYLCGIGEIDPDTFVKWHDVFLCKAN